jgi:hypothetical protein
VDCPKLRAAIIDDMMRGAIGSVQDHEKAKDHLTSWYYVGTIMKKTDLYN